MRWQHHPLGVRAEAYWKEHRPRYYRHLKKSGELDEGLNAALNDTLKAMADLMQRGLQEHEAREAMLSEWLFPPGEEESLRPDPNN